MTQRTELIERMVKLAADPANQGKTIAYAAADSQTMRAGFYETVWMLVDKGHSHSVHFMDGKIVVVEGATIMFYTPGRRTMIYGSRNIGVFLDDSRDHFYEMVLALRSTQNDPGPFGYSSGDRQ